MSTASDAIDIGVSLLAGVAKLVPPIAGWLRGAAQADPDHPISKRVAEILPAESASREALTALEKD